MRGLTLLLLVIMTSTLHSQWPRDWNLPFEGACVILDPVTEEMEVWNDSLAGARLSPCSTFKIPNSLIALETGVLQDTTSRLRWDGIVRSIPSWNSDHSLNTAFRHSAVWYYQEVARRIGMRSMKRWVNRVMYGNDDVSGGIDRFWLNSSLRISAREQVGFLRKLWNRTLPFSLRTQDLVLSLMKFEVRQDVTLYGKTGTGDVTSTVNHGWYVGFLNGPFGVRIFAVLLVGPQASGALARERAIRIFEYRGWFPKTN